ncbi:MAG: RnfABCDGE type electron transport complex subunit D [candidate division WOR-3 bacterium]|nr:MAG: RnfABCDGE type electron transport complex subunit D [candidate division WOR-3 bacterium]
MANKKSLAMIRQPIMRRMIRALLPCVIASVYFFGWRSLVVVAVSCITGFVTEYAFTRRRDEPVSEAVFVSAIIYALILPPTIPFHILIFGMVFAIVFGKMVFGGFGSNIFNPAMVGRAFLYICFPIAMTATWASAAPGPWGALGLWSTGSLPDAVTAATPMALVKAGQALPPSLTTLFIGRLAGSMGVTSVLAILIGGIYVFYTRTANRYIIVTVIIVYALINGLLTIAGTPANPGILPALMGGGFLFGAFFMATDPISAPRTRPAMIIYAAIIATGTAIIRTFSVFNGGLMFSILLANMFAPILDYTFKNRVCSERIVKDTKEVN